MLGILLTILKIILWVILGILGLALLLLFFVLFSPVRYKFDVDYHENAHVVAIIKYLVVKVKVSYDQANKEMQQTIRIFGFQIGKGKKKSKAADDTELKCETDDFDTELKCETDDFDAEKVTWNNFADTADNESVGGIKDQASSSEPLLDNQDNQEEFKMNDPLYDLWDDDLSEPLSDGEKKFFGRLLLFLKKIINGLKNISLSRLTDKLRTKKDKLNKKINRIKRFYNLSCTVKTRAYFKKYIKSVMKHILPRKICGYVHYGFEEPYKTGQITGYLSVIPFVYHKHLSIKPDFYNKIIEVNVRMKGRIRVGYLLRIALNINVWRTLKALRRITK